MVEQLQKLGREFVQLQKKKKMQSLWHLMVHFLLVLILGLSTISCSPVLPKVGCEFSNQLVEDSDKLKIKLWSGYLMCQITSPISQDKISHTGISHND